MSPQGRLPLTTEATTETDDDKDPDQRTVTPPHPSAFEGDGHPRITLDIEGFIDHVDESEVVIVGHGYGIHPVLGAADRRPERIARLVHLDAAMEACRAAEEIRFSQRVRYPVSRRLRRVGRASSPIGALRVQARRRVARKRSLPRTVGRAVPCR